MPGTGSIATAGAIGVPGTRFYQIFYRNMAPYCTAATMNATNAIAVGWSP